MTIAEIKKQMTDAFIADSTVKRMYSLQDGKGFEEQFSMVSLENIIFFIVATAMWLNAQLFEQHKVDVLEILRDNRAHTANWYATRAKEFQYGHELVPGTDKYDNSNLSDEQIRESQVVKFSASVESDDQSLLLVKVAALSEDVKEPLNTNQLVAFSAYLNRIKDAGVRIKIINSPADDLKLEMDIYYDPLVLDSNGVRLDGDNDTPVQDAIRAYISNLSFNGLYVNQSLVDKLQAVDGVDIAELKQASARYGDMVGYTAINAKSRPHAGYYQVTNKNLLLNFIAND